MCQTVYYLFAITVLLPSKYCRNKKKQFCFSRRIFAITYMTGNIITSSMSSMISILDMLVNGKVLVLTNIHDHGRGGSMNYVRGRKARGRSDRPRASRANVYVIMKYFPISITPNIIWLATYSIKLQIYEHYSYFHHNTFILEGFTRVSTFFPDIHGYFFLTIDL